MTKIFITIPWFFPAYKAGGPVQSIVNLVHHLDEGFEFYIFTSDTDLDGEPLTGITPGQWIQYNAYTKVWYAPKEHRSNILLKQAELVKPGLLYIVGIYSWYFTQVPILFSKVPVKLLSVRGMLHPGALAEKSLKKKLYLRLARWLQLSKRVTFHATDAAERGFIMAALEKNVNVYEAGNFSRFTEAVQAPPEKKVGQLMLITIALISPIKHILGVLEALQGCQSRVHYDVYGPVKDHLYMNDCRQLARTLPENITVKFHGEVSPVFVPEVLAKAQVFIMPSRSENFGHAIAEALGAGLPVITSHHTPWNGLEIAKAGINADDNMDALKAAIERFAGMDQAEMQAWRAGAKHYVATQVDPLSVKAQYHQMFNEITQHGG